MENVLENLRYDVKNWWWYLVSGLLFIATGIAIYASPVVSYVNLNIVFSILMIGNGFSQIIFSTSNSKQLRGWQMDPRIGHYRCCAWNLPAPLSRRHHGNTAIFRWLLANFSIVLPHGNCI